MTSLNEALNDRFYQIVNEQESTVSTIDVDSLLITADHCTSDDIEAAASYLIEALERDASDWLSFEVYKDERGEFKAEILITCGGPTVRLEYESFYDYLRFEYSSAYTCISADISTDSLTAGGELAETIKELASAY